MNRIIITHRGEKSRLPPSEQPEQDVLRHRHSGLALEGEGGGIVGKYLAVGVLSAGQSQGPSAQVIEQRLERRNRRMQTKDVYAGRDSVRLIDGYGEAIRKARSAKGMDAEQFAASISEKKGIIMKVESEDLTPDDKLVKKIEKALDITLTETVQGGGSIGKGGSNAKMTLADFIKKE